MSMQKTNRGSTALHYTETLEVAKALVEHGADIEAVANLGDTPLILNSYNGRVDIIKYLLSVGANKEAKNNKGQTAYDVACDWYFQNDKEQRIAELKEILK